MSANYVLSKIINIDRNYHKYIIGIVLRRKYSVVQKDLLQKLSFFIVVGQ